MKINNASLKGRETVSAWGVLSFDAEGNIEVEEDIGQQLLTIPGFAAVPEPEVVAPAPKSKKAKETN